MKQALIVFVMLFVMSGISFAQTMAQPQPPTYVPILTNESKFNSFINLLSDIPMTGKTWQQIMILLQQLEREAVQEKIKSESEKKND